MKLENVKEWLKKHKIKKLVKDCIISMLAIYFIVSMNSLLSNYNYKTSTVSEIIGKLKIIDYMDKHPNLSNINVEEHYKLCSLLSTYKYENNVSIEDIKKDIRSGKENSISEFYKNTNYSIETFEEMLDLFEIEHKYSVGFEGEDIQLLKKTIKSKNYSIAQVISELENNNFGVISEFFDEYKYQYYCVKYPEVISNMQLTMSSMSEQISNITTSLILGIFIGSLIYAYSNIEEMKKFIIFIVIDIVIIAILEFVIQIDISGTIKFEMNNENWSMSTGSIVPVFQSMTAITVFISVVLSIIKIVLNKIRINKLNKINNTKIGE